MSALYVCCSCRARLFRLHVTQRGLRRQQWISYSPQDRSESNSVQGWRRAPTTSTRYSRRQVDNNSEAPIDSGHNADEQKASLQPRDLLGKLETPSDFLRRNTTPALYQAFAEFWKVQNRDDAKTWEAVQNIIASARNTDELKLLGQAQEKFISVLWVWTVRTAHRWLHERLGRSSFESNVTERETATPWRSSVLIPGPALTMSFHNAILPEVMGSNWVRLLWLVSTETLEAAVRNSSMPRVALVDSISELMALWNQCMRLHLERDLNVDDKGIPIFDDFALKERSKDWSFLPNTSALPDLLKRLRRDSIEKGLELFTPSPQQPVRKRIEDVHRRPMDYASPALVTLHLLRNLSTHDGICLGELAANRPWVELFEAIIQNSFSTHIPRGVFAKMRAGRHAEVDEAYKAVAAALQPKTRSRTEAIQKSIGPDAALESATNCVQGNLNSSENSQVLAEASNASDVENFVELSQKRLGRALEKQDVILAQRIHQEIMTFQSRLPGSSLPLCLFETLIHTFLSLRNAQAAATVWRDLVSAGHRPTIKTYTVMMKGAQHARDIKGLQSFWKRMRDSGLRPDVHAWSVYIFALLRSGRKDSGLEALHEMSREWVMAARSKSPPSRKGIPALTVTELVAKYKDDIDGVVRPNIVIMNSAISALASNHDSQIPKILAWGRSFGIEPDIVTYNALINIAMRHDLPEEATDILHRMTERGIEPNNTTWTVLLAAILHGDTWRHLSPTEQGSHIMEFINSISPISTKQDTSNAKGVVIDQKGYALIIDRLLKGYRNTAAARAVLEHMQRQGVQPSVHIYTILMTAYFQEYPPNFVAAEALWEGIQSAQQGYGHGLDAVFYDRMIEGYAEHHESVGSSAPMLRFLRRMEQEGKTPSWLALLSAAKCLAERGERENLTRVVNNARVRLQEAGVNIVGPQLNDPSKTGKRAFWEYIIDTGILEREGIYTLDQLMQQSPLPKRSRGVLAELQSHTHEL